MPAGRLTQRLAGSLPLPVVVNLPVGPLIYVLLAALIRGRAGLSFLQELPLRQQLGRRPVYVLVTVRLLRVVDGLNPVPLRVAQCVTVLVPRKFSELSPHLVDRPALLAVHRRLKWKSVLTPFKEEAEAPKPPT